MAHLKVENVATLEIDFSDLKLEQVKTVIKGKPVVIIHFRGKINNENYHALNRKIYGFANGQDYNLILDLSRLEYINSSGVAILFHLFSRVHKNNGRVLIGGVHRFLRRVFSLMDLPPEVRIYEDLKEAESAF